MALEIEIEWQKPLELLDGWRHNMIYVLEYEEGLPEEPGIYVFARKYGKNIAPLYIGQAKNLRSRICGQLNTTRLMKGIENAENGHRVLMVGVCRTKPGQQLKKVLDVLERAYIDHALTDGYELLNKQGAHRPIHRITSSGPRKGHVPFPRRMNVKTQ